MAACQAGGEAAPGPLLTVEPCGASVSVAAAPQHGARSVERTLEDAASSGLLELSGRRLRDFPQTRCDLTDTTQADLSKNRFTEIPPEVCLFIPLESLNLYHNCIRGVPEAIVNLRMLTYLNISRNLLTVLPKYLFELPLKVLVLSNNKLASVPEEIGKCAHLMQLDISCNEIQMLPAQMGSLRSLRELNVCRNCLYMLPDELADLPLVMLDFSCNKVTEIPPVYRRMRHLQLLVLDNNPLHSPPAQICLKGKVHIFKYLSGQACRLGRKPDPLDLSTLNKRNLLPPLTGSLEDFYRIKTHGPDSGIGSDNGDKRLSTTEPSDDDTVSLHSQVSENARDVGRVSYPRHEQSRDAGDYGYLNAEEEAGLVDGCAKTGREDLEGVLHESEHSEGKEESGREKESQAEEDEEDELQEVSDLREIAAQLLQQEQQNSSSSPLEDGGTSETTPEASHAADLGTLTVFGLKPRSAFSRGSRQEIATSDPGFTIRRKIEHMREEMEQIQHLRQNLEARLKVLLPEDMDDALTDGVILCHLANHIRPRSVASIHVPSPAVPKLSMAKCRRNVENFLDACKRLGVPKDKICLPHHILEGRGLVQVGLTVQALLDLPPVRHSHLLDV